MKGYLATLNKPDHNQDIHYVDGIVHPTLDDAKKACEKLFIAAKRHFGVRGPDITWKNHQFGGAMSHPLYVGTFIIDELDVCVGG